MIFFFHPMPRFGIPVVYFCNVNNNIIIYVERNNGKYDSDRFAAVGRNYERLVSVRLDCH